MFSVIFIIILILSIIYFSRKEKICILIEKLFIRHYDLPKSPITCKKNKKKYKCYLLYNSSKKCSAIIYNGNLQKNIMKSNYNKNIIMASEKLSQVKHMIAIGEGKNKNYMLGVDYRLFNNKYHISYPIYSYYNIKEFIKQAFINYDSISSFLNRKNVVYIQRIAYYKRQYIVKEFMKYISVDSYGKDLNNKEWPKKTPSKNKIDILKQYKFCLAIENSVILWKIGTKFEATDINNDYVTEKLIDCLIAGAIPIYFGAKTVKLFLPHPNAIINFSNFKSIKELTDYVKHIMNNKNLLIPHLMWHSNISKEWYYRFNVNFSFSYCKICNRIKNK